jgi:hypothetical protein
VLHGIKHAGKCALEKTDYPAPHLQGQTAVKGAVFKMRRKRKPHDTNSPTFQQSISSESSSTKSLKKTSSGGKGKEIVSPSAENEFDDAFDMGEQSDVDDVEMGGTGDDRRYPTEMSPMERLEAARRSLERREGLSGLRRTRPRSSSPDSRPTS